MPQGSQVESVSGPVRVQEGQETSRRTSESSPGSTSSSRLSSQVTLDSTQESMGSAEEDHRGGASPTSPGNGAARVGHTASMRHTAGIGMLGKTLAPQYAASSPPRTSARGALGPSGVMPRRSQLPSPPSSTSHPLSRVFKVIFLGEPVSSIQQSLSILEP